MNKSWKLLLAISALSAAPILQGCLDESKADSDSTPVPAAFTVIKTSSGGRADHRKLEVIGSQQDFNAAYYEVSPDASLAPSVDFNTLIVIGAYMGMHATGGYSISVESVNITEFNVEIKAKSTAPGSNCVTTQAFTSPFQFISIAKTTKPIIFNESYTVINC